MDVGELGGIEIGLALDLDNQSEEAMEMSGVFHGSPRIEKTRCERPQSRACAAGAIENIKPATLPTSHWKRQTRSWDAASIKDFDPLLRAPWRYASRLRPGQGFGNDTPVGSVLLGPGMHP